MALFKILQGDSSRISTTTTPFHEGYAYFTPDDGKFYIDSIVNGQEKRICVNASCTHLSATLSASGWSAGSQTLTLTGIKPETDGWIGLSQTATGDQKKAAENAELYLRSQNQDSLTIAAYGQVPTCDIPVDVILLR